MKAQDIIRRIALSAIAVAGIYSVLVVFSDAILPYDEWGLVRIAFALITLGCYYSYRWISAKWSE